MEGYVPIFVFVAVIEIGGAFLCGIGSLAILAFAAVLNWVEERQSKERAFDLAEEQLRAKGS